MRILIKEKFDPKLIGKESYPFFEKIFYRKISKTITPIIAKTKINPSIINIIGFLIGISGLLLVALGTYPIRFLGCLVLLFSYTIDCVDGELARGFKVSNKFGALLDTTLDSIKESLVMFALGGAYYRQTGDEQIEIYLVAILFSQRMFGRTLAWYRMLYKEKINDIKNESLRKFPKVLRPLGYFFSEAYRSGTIWIVVLIGILTNQIIAILIYFIIIVFGLFVFLIYQSYKHQREYE